MTKQTNGWQLQSSKTSHNARIARAKQAADLKRSRVQGDDHTPAELVAIHAGLKADYYAREAQRRAAA